MGRKEKKIDQRQFETLCSIQCTKEEIEAVLGVANMTLSKWCKETYGTTFDEVKKRFMQIGFASLRRNQFKMSESNASMAIFLGKQYLGQKDNAEPTMARIEVVNSVPSMPDTIPTNEEYEEEDKEDDDK